MGAELELSGSEISEAQLSQRQKEVLTVALNLLVEAGDALTMNDVAQRASCSKETLYKWFGGREGLLTATVQWQAAKVRMPVLDQERLDFRYLEECLQQFAESWLEVLTGDISIALNRLAVGHAGSSKSGLGKVVLHNGPFAMSRRLRPLLELARDSGLVEFEDVTTAFRTFFGLVVRDVQIRALLGDEERPTRQSLSRDAQRATRQFLALFGAEKYRPEGQ